MHRHSYYRILEDLYRRYNRRELVWPDPLQFLYDYPDARDREVVGIVAATLAVGNVKAIVRSVGRALALLGPRPAAYLETVSDARLLRGFADFKHRFFTGADVAGLLAAARAVQREHGLLGACFAEGLARRDETVQPALERFVRVLASAGCGRACHNFVPDPGRRSACKRLHLFLRWMVRQDEVDPGGWRGVPASHLIVPLDTHMFRIGVRLGFVTRKVANLAAALELTAAFRRIRPDDPVRYDFALTRLGIRTDADLEGLLARFAAARRRGV
ncbi:MAG: TIGR02757 family protein [Planctomycetes bacterium]|nr:TIGR02757 family protein [Planctomycetota bacterium]